MPDDVVPAITLSDDELKEKRAEVASGLLPPNWFELYRKSLENSVFGVDHKNDSNGKPIEQGIGAKGFETGNHFASLRRAEEQGFENPGSYQAACAELWNRDPAKAQSLSLPQPRARA